MTYHETAALEQSASGLEDVRDAGEAHELRQWTIKNLETEVVDRARAAARRKGMKIGAWVAETLRTAADDQLDSGHSPASKLSNDLERIVARLEAIRLEDHQRIERIERDISQLVRGQHGILAEMLIKGSKELPA